MGIVWMNYNDINVTTLEWLGVGESWPYDTNSSRIKS